MRRIKAAICIVLFILVIAAASHITVRRTTDTLQTHLSEIRVLAQDGDYTNAKQQTKEMLQYLKSHQHWLELFIKRETIAAITINLHGLSAYANEECVNDLMNEIDKASEQIAMTQHLFFSVF